MANRHMKRCSTSIIREMQIKTIVRYYLTPVKWLLSKRQEIISVGKNVKKREPLCSVGGTVKWWSHYGKQYGGSLKKCLNTITLPSSNSSFGYLTKENIQMVNKHMKRCSTSLIIREMQIKTMKRYHFMPIRMARYYQKTENNKC